MTSARNGSDAKSSAPRVRAHRTNVAALAARQDQTEDILLALLDRIARLEDKLARLEGRPANPVASILLATSAERRDEDARDHN